MLNIFASKLILAEHNLELNSCKRYNIQDIVIIVLN